MKPLHLIFAGSGEFGLPTLAALADSGHLVDLVVSQPDRPAGRGRKLTPTPISQFAIERNRPLLRTDDINQAELPNVDAMIVIAFGQKISQPVADRPRLGSMNLHASRLPKYRGAAPIHWAILRGETVTGNSVIRLAPRMDAGAILAQSNIEIEPLETVGELHDRLAKDGVGLILKTLEELDSGSAREAAQDESVVSTAPKLSRGDAAIDFAKSAAIDVCRKVRGMYPWPGCQVNICDAAGEAIGRATLVRVRPAAGEGAAWESGEVMIDGNVSLGDGTEAIEIVELQPQGKRAMKLEEYRRGNAWQPGLRLESVT